MVRFYTSNIADYSFAKIEHNKPANIGISLLAIIISEKFSKLNQQ